MALPEYDVLIVGSGASGGAAAYTLTKLGIKCLMLEAGPPVDFVNNQVNRRADELPYRGFMRPGRLPHLFQADEFNANRWVDEVEVPYTHEEGLPYNWVRARYVGGKSLFWARMSFRLSDYEFRAKDHDGFGENWPIRHADLDKYYSRAEGIFRVRGRKEGLPQLPDGNFMEDDTPFSPANRKLKDVGATMGIPVTKIRTAMGRGPLASSQNLLLPDAIATGNLTIVPNAVVRNITTDPDTGLVNGANFVDRHSKREMHAKARVVVLGASCLESTRILLNSEIANSSGVLGHYLHDQFYRSNSVVAILPEVRDKKVGGGYAGGGGYIPRFKNLDKREPDFIRGYSFDFRSGVSPDPEYLPYYGKQLAEEIDRHEDAAFTGTLMGSVLARYENHARINKDVTDAYGIPVLHFECKYTDNEHNMFQDAIATMSELCENCGWEVLSRYDNMYPPGYSIHEVGTCRMGDDPKTSVLNKWNQSHDIKNLFVVDGSSFVTAGSQNPTMTILALSMRASEYLAEQMRRGDL